MKKILLMFLLVFSMSCLSGCIFFEMVHEEFFEEPEEQLAKKPVIYLYPEEK